MKNKTCGMKMCKKALLKKVVSYAVAVGVGFGAGIYALPILVAGDSADVAVIEANEANASYKTEFVRDLKGSDLLHHGVAQVSVSPDSVTVNGVITPGPDLKLYFTDMHVTNEEEFLAIKDDSVLAASVGTYENFVIGHNVNIENHNSIIIWCEKFSQFITSAKYK